MFVFIRSAFLSNIYEGKEFGLNFVVKFNFDEAFVIEWYIWMIMTTIDWLQDWLKNTVSQRLIVGKIVQRNCVTSIDFFV